MPSRLLVLGECEHAEHHPHRHRPCHLGHPLHAPTPGRAVYDVVRERLDRWGERHRFRLGERLCSDLAKPRVLRRVAELEAILREKRGQV